MSGGISLKLCCYFLIILCFILVIASVLTTPLCAPSQTLSSIQQFDIIHQHTNIHDRSQIDYNEIFSSISLKKDYVKLNRSPKKISSVFIIGIEGSGHHWMATLFNNLLDNALYQANYGLADPILYHGMSHCFAYEKINKIPPTNSTYLLLNLSKEYKVLSACNAVQKRFDYYSETMWNNTMLFHSGLSYPFGIDDINQLSNTFYPDILQMIQWTQNAKPYPFDVRIIYIRRNWKECMLSVIRRYNKAAIRIELLQHSLNIIQTQLLAIDPEFYIAINMNDIFERMEQYKDIFCRLLSPYLTDYDVQKGLYLQMHDRQSKPHNYSAPNAYDGIMAKHYWIGIDNILSDKINLIKWQLLLSEKIIVMPESMSFLNAKKFAKCRKSISVR